MLQHLIIFGSLGILLSREVPFLLASRGYLKKIIMQKGREGGTISHIAYVHESIALKLVIVQVMRRPR